MTKITLDNYTIRQIAGHTGLIVSRNMGPMPAYPDTAPPGVGEEAFSIVISPDKEQQMRDLLPHWSLREEPVMYVGVWRPKDNSPQNATRHIAQLQKPRLFIPGNGLITDVPGIERAFWDGHCLAIAMEGDGSGIKLPKLRDFLIEVSAIDKAHNERQAVIYKAADDITKYLGQFKTLNQAVKQFGPSLVEFLPPHIKQAYEREPPKRVRRSTPKAAPVDVDINYLIAEAAAHRLQLNN